MKLCYFTTATYPNPSFVHNEVTKFVTRRRGRGCLKFAAILIIVNQSNK
jgi:hypothetical protein